MSRLGILGKITPLVRAVTSFGADRRANVAVIFAVSMLPLTFALGSVADYSMASSRRAHLNAVADAAALSAVTSTAMAMTPQAAQQQAIAFFNSQAALISGITYTNNVTITVTDSNATNAIVRTAKVSYSIRSLNTFAGVLGMPSMTLGGSSQASATKASNIDFYLMIDTSPSMEIAATQAGIATMVAATTNPTSIASGQSACAFACHQSSGTGILGNPGGEDNYALARSLGVTLRIDLVTQAVSNLMTTAKSTAQSAGAAYRMAGYTFDVAVNNPIPLTANLTTAQTQSANIAPLQVYSNNNLTASINNGDKDTDFDLAFNTINTAMPNPGNGTNAAGDTPQEVLFIVTDGVADVSYNGARSYTPFGNGAGANVGTNPAWCTQIKARGIRIAVLYTTYYPLPTNSWYNTYISGEQPSIATAAQACASPGLYYQVNTGGDISAALTALFQTAVASAHLTH